MSLIMKYTSEGVPKNWDGKDWQTYKWGMTTVFKENDLRAIAVGSTTKEMLATARAQKQEEFEKKHVKIMQMIGMSLPSEVLQQIRDKKTGLDMWEKLCNLYEGKQNEAVRVKTIRRVEHELWIPKLTPEGDANLHMCKC
uniref:Uncharacterized protein n=1 Tax=Peronospora matthiolae TaxID=2874970 RepID=A0AAV1TU06_9STRA